MGWPAGNVGYLEVRPAGDNWAVMKTNNSRFHRPDDDRLEKRFGTKSAAYEWAKNEVNVRNLGAVMVQNRDGELIDGYWAPRHRRIELRPMPETVANRYKQRLEKYDYDTGRKPYWAVYVRDEAEGETHYDRVWNNTSKGEAVKGAKKGAEGQIKKKLVIKDRDGNVQETWMHPLARKIE